MDGFTVHCPLGTCHGAVRLRQGVGVYYLQAYHEDPETPVGYPDPSPAATAGGDRFVDERRRRELLVTCTDDHYLRLHMADEPTVSDGDCLYGPVTTERVRCPDCAFEFGAWPAFRIRTVGATEREHALRSVTTAPPDGYHSTTDVSRSIMTRYDHVAHRRQCPNCGRLLSFNFDRR